MASDAMRPVGALMTGTPLSVDEKMTLRSLAAVLSDMTMGCALVRRDHEWVGIISERDVLRALSGDADPDEVWAADVMTEKIVTTDAGERVLNAALRMIDEDVRHLAVTEEGRIVGVVSMRDLFRVLAEGLAASA